MTAVIAALAAVTRLINLWRPPTPARRSSTRSTTRRRPGRCCTTTGSRTTPDTGWSCTRRSARADRHRRGDLRVQRPGLAIHRRGRSAWWWSALVARIVRRISRSTLVGGIAGLLLIADGVSFVSARTALLDGFLALFVVAAFGALIVDRDQMRARMHVAYLEGRIAETPWGPRLGVRWWRFGAGVLLGLALPQSGPGCTTWCSSRRCRWRSTSPRGGSTGCRGRGWACSVATLPDRVCAGDHSVRGVPGRLMRRGSHPRRRSTATRWASRSAPAVRCPTRSARCGTTPKASTSSTPG